MTRSRGVGCPSRPATGGGFRGVFRAFLCAFDGAPDATTSQIEKILILKKLSTITRAFGLLPQGRELVPPIAAEFGLKVTSAPD
jgi:hypothetical protein